jgi:hypothetical protein
MDPLERLVALQDIPRPRRHVRDGVRRPLQFADDGQSAVVDTDVVWIAQNFENTILARYYDDVVQQDGRGLIKRREEIPLQFKAGPPPMSDTAMAVSAGTLKE